MIELPKLPWGESDLAPHISQETISFHYGKHHKAYVDNTNKMIAGTELADGVARGHRQGDGGQARQEGPLQQLGPGVEPHLLLEEPQPEGRRPAHRQAAAMVKSDFGDFAKFKEELAKAAVTQFGSGWAWVVVEGGKLKVEQTPNAETPLTNPAKKPLLTIDVWEHAYYVDYRNRRPDYVTAVLDKLINWEFAAANLG